MELALYNAVLTAMSHEGTKFTYVNQLASSDEDPSKREEWFTCACCPPNVMRLLGCIGGYIWTHKSAEASGTQIDVHLYINSVLAFEAGEGERVELEQKSDYPWSGDITFKLRTPSKSVALNVRFPAWAEDWSVSTFPSVSYHHALANTIRSSQYLSYKCTDGFRFQISPIAPKAATHDGYLNLPADWLAANPTFTLSLPLTPRKIAPHPSTNQDIVALARGPVVYCIEDVDNAWAVKGDHFKVRISLCSFERS